jgi:hypothetical protein
MAFDASRLACFAINRHGALRVAFRETRGSALADIGLPAMTPQIIEKPAPPVAPPPAPGPAMAAAAIAPVSIREPLGAWHVFEPRTGLHCQITLFDAPAQPFRSLTRDGDCGAMASMQRVDRWSQDGDGIFLRDRRGRVFFRFGEAGPTALRAKWRRSDFIMMARDLRAFAVQTPVAAQAPETPPAASPVRPGLTGTWRLRGPGRQSCFVRLSVDPASAATIAQPDGCQGTLAKVNGWSFRRGALVLERGGAPLARFVEGRGVTWFGRFEGGPRTLRMVKQ